MRTEAGGVDGRRWGSALGVVSWSDPAGLGTVGAVGGSVHRRTKMHPDAF
jgi:hypothetical protein